MELILYRDIYTKKSTLGKLYQVRLDGDEDYICETLEDARRFPGIKVEGETCIPAGRYLVDVSFSNRFDRDMPMLSNYANGYELKAEGISFKGIRMHGGNTHANTAGCILVAYNRIDDDTIQGTAESDVTHLIQSSPDLVWIEIIDQVEET